MILLPILLSSLWGEPSRCLEEDGGFTTEKNIRHFAVATNTVYIAAEENLYQLNHDLTLVQNLTLRGILTGGHLNNDARFYRGSVTNELNATFSVNILLPFVMNGTLVSCGVIECGYCEVLDLKNISNVLYREHIQVGSPLRNSASVGFLVNEEGKHAYILAALQQDETKSTGSSCPTGSEAVHLHNTNHIQRGYIFSTVGEHNTHVIKREGSVEFVDGFQINSIIYLFSNLPSSNTPLRGWRERRKTPLFLCDPGGAPVLWSGVFSVDGGKTNTELLLFDISPDLNMTADADPDFCSVCPVDKKKTAETLKPKAVLFRQKSMTSVLAVRHKAWMVFFIGTGDGQLMKLSVDQNFQSSCPGVLYRDDYDRRVFPKMHLDPVDLKHVYMSFENQMKRVAVSKCGTYTDVLACWSAQDPHCVWCGSTISCTFEDECPNSDWLSIPDDSQQKMVSHKVMKDSTGQVTLNIHTHLTVGQKALDTYSCNFSPSSSDFSELCSRESPFPKFPQCTCILSNSSLPAEGRRDGQRMSCVESVSGLDVAGAATAVPGQTKEWGMTVFANNGVNDEPFKTRDLLHHTQNHAVLSGSNLRDVIRVRIQCTQHEYPVWNNTGVRLTFHIPGANSKGVVKVCVVLPDGSCHGNTKITYQSSPSCTDITPSSTWISGKRNITLMGSHLELVEGVMHSHCLQEVIPRSSNYQNLTYESPAAGKGVSAVKVFLKVGNKSLPCHKTMSYHPEPEFISFTSTVIGEDLRITIQEGNTYPCIMKDKETSNETDFLICEIERTPFTKFQQLMIKYGDRTVTLNARYSIHMYLILLVLLLIPCICVVVVIIYRNQQKKLTAKMNRCMEDLELDIRNDIRQGFVDLQTEKADLMENVGTIPFLDYKHFASRIFFPEDDSLMRLCIKDIGQDVVKVQLDDCCQGLSRLLQDQLFLTSMVHALEEQKSFTIKDKCALASLLTVALHHNLSYLTEVMEALLKVLTQQNSNAQPKLLLRRTESTVEKLLTNWMSICLYGFLR
ncbi:hypothetical protein KUCAC02_034126, partial [Chaenocephalus aceratus]